MSAVRQETIAAKDAGVRLDRWFRRLAPDLGHGRLEKLLRTGQIRVDGKRAKASQRLEAGQVVRVPPLPGPQSEVPGSGLDVSAVPSAAITGRSQQRTSPASQMDSRIAADLQARVLHKDDAVLVIDKPAGLAVQGGSGTTRHIDGLLDSLRFDGTERPRLVHRLDKDTSGVLVLARNAAAARSLTAAFKTKSVRKLYWALVVGRPNPQEGTIDLPLAKQPGRGGERMQPDLEDGRSAITLFRTIEAAGRRAAWLALMPVTGRTHQLRVHCAEIGHPILGDGKYGGADAFLPGLEDLGAGVRRLHLHARAISLPHPVKGTVTVTAPLPDHMRETWRFFEFEPKRRGDPFEGFEAIW